MSILFTIKWTVISTIVVAILHFVFYYTSASYNTNRVIKLKTPLELNVPDYEYTKREYDDATPPPPPDIDKDKDNMKDELQHYANELHIA